MMMMMMTTTMELPGLCRCVRVGSRLRGEVAWGTNSRLDTSTPTAAVSQHIFSFVLRCFQTPVSTENLTPAAGWGAVTRGVAGAAVHMTLCEFVARVAGDLRRGRGHCFED